MRSYMKHTQAQKKDVENSDMRLHANISCDSDIYQCHACACVVEGRFSAM